MKRDLKLNISELRVVYRSIRSAWEALGEIAYSSGRFREVLKNQDSLAYERLTRLWEERIEEEEKELSTGTISSRLRIRMTHITF